MLNIISSFVTALNSGLYIFQKKSFLVKAMTTLSVNLVVCRRLIPQIIESIPFDSCMDHLFYLLHSVMWFIFPISLIG